VGQTVLHSCGERKSWFIAANTQTNASAHRHRSTHNTRIERLWLESGRHFARGWRAFFTRLERLYFLDKDDPHHIWLLHTLFLEDIQNDCDEFQRHWNSHPLSGKGQNMSPLVCTPRMSFASYVKNSFSGPSIPRSDSAWYL